MSKKEIINFIRSYNKLSSKDRAFLIENISKPINSKVKRVREKEAPTFKALKYDARYHRAPDLEEDNKYPYLEGRGEVRVLVEKTDTKEKFVFVYIDVDLITYLKNFHHYEGDENTPEEYDWDEGGVEIDGFDDAILDEILPYNGERNLFRAHGEISDEVDDEITEEIGEAILEEVSNNTVEHM